MHLPFVHQRARIVRSTRIVILVHIKRDVVGVRPIIRACQATIMETHMDMHVLVTLVQGVFDGVNVAT